MKTKRILLITGICIMTELGLAQNHLPPVFGNDTTNIRHDEISQLYLSPRKVVWTSSESSVSTPRVLLKLSDGQSEMVKENTCRLRSMPNDTAAILLDYGRELHGGLKLILGPSNKREPATIRIRFGESASEACSPIRYTGWKKVFPPMIMPCGILR
ncbi:hypothetical protein NXV57_01630 [Bacteroides thetaiotaomicron]|nr:hypothetical protein [Bacteroides thetaiotaomicron]